MNILVVSESICTIVSFIIRTLLIVSALGEVALYVVCFANDLVRKRTILTSIVDSFSAASLANKRALGCRSVCPFDSVRLGVNVGGNQLHVYYCRS